MATKKYKEKPGKSKAEEPQEAYGEKAFPYNTVRPSTFEDLENDNRLYSLSLSPEQRLKYLLELNLNAYGRKSLLVKDFGTKIIPD